MAAARTLGMSMANAGIGLVYGGGSIGLMGEVARTVIAHGGDVTGIIPEFLVKRERMLDEGDHELIRVDDMHQRKMLMFERASGHSWRATQSRSLSPISTITGGPC